MGSALRHLRHPLRSYAGSKTNPRVARHTHNASVSVTSLDQDQVGKGYGGCSVSYTLSDHGDTIVSRHNLHISITPLFHAWLRLIGCVRGRAELDGSASSLVDMPLEVVRRPGAIEAQWIGLWSENSGPDFVPAVLQHHSNEVTPNPQIM